MADLSSAGTNVYLLCQSLQEKLYRIFGHSGLLLWWLIFQLAPTAQAQLQEKILMNNNNNRKAFEEMEMRLTSLPLAHGNVYLQAQRQEKVNPLRSSILTVRLLHKEAGCSLWVGVSGHKLVTNPSVSEKCRVHGFPQGWSWSAPVLSSFGISCPTAAGQIYMWVKGLRNILCLYVFIWYRVGRVTSQSFTLL